MPAVFNDHSIGVCYEGGLDEQGQPADTRTMEQKIALIALLRQLRLDYPEARIAGHNELSTNVHKACPCFKASGNIRIYKIVSISGRLRCMPGAFYDYLP